jgi:hemerythrin superfamily protein
MDIFEHLKTDHRKVADIMSRIQSASAADERVRLFGELKDELVRHSKAEDQTFYSFLERFEEMEDLIAEAREDHQMIDTLLSEIDSLSADGSSAEEWTARFEELKECVEDHVDQEETEIFEEARELIDDNAANDLERRMAVNERQVQPSL